MHSSAGDATKRDLTSPDADNTDGLPAVGSNTLFSSRSHRADRLLLVVMAALWIRELCSDSELASDACLLFVALQSCLSYITPGILKLRAVDWRSGAALHSILCHPVFGHAGLAAMAKRHPRRSKICLRSVILIQIAFPAGMLLSPAVCLACIIAAAVFHAMSAIFMGLGRFVPAWAATYPAVLYVATGISESMKW